MVQPSPFATLCSLDTDVGVTLLGTDGRSIVRGATITVTPGMSLADLAAAAAAGAGVSIRSVEGAKVSRCSARNQRPFGRGGAHTREEQRRKEEEILFGVRQGRTWD